MTSYLSGYSYSKFTACNKPETQDILCASICWCV